MARVCRNVMLWSLRQLQSLSLFLAARFHLIAGAAILLTVVGTPYLIRLQVPRRNPAAFLYRGYKNAAWRHLGHNLQSGCVGGVYPVCPKID